MFVRDNIPESWVILLANGYKIKNNTCNCGGNYAWMRPVGTQSYEMAGCICCTDADALAKDLPYKKKLDLDALETEAKRLVSLLKDRQPGLMSWTGFFVECTEKISRLLW
jgi:hypothetical protein